MDEIIAMRAKSIKDFPIGMEVTVLKEIDWYVCLIPYGSIGVVVGYGWTGNPLVEFTQNIGGHGGVLDKEGKPGHCWWIFPENLVTLDNIDG